MFGKKKEYNIEERTEKITFYIGICNSCGKKLKYSNKDQLNNNMIQHLKKHNKK